MKCEKCDTCSYYHKKYEDSGECRRNAPGLGGTSEYAYTCWPGVQRNDWCGEHKRKDSQ